MSSLLSIHPARLLHFPYHSHFPRTRNIRIYSRLQYLPLPRLVATKPVPCAGQPSPPSIENTPLVDQPGAYVSGPNVTLEVVSLCIIDNSVTSRIEAPHALVDPASTSHGSGFFICSPTLRSRYLSFMENQVMVTRILRLLPTLSVLICTFNLS